MSGNINGFWGMINLKICKLFRKFKVLSSQVLVKVNMMFLIFSFQVYGADLWGKM